MKFLVLMVVVLVGCGKASLVTRNNIYDKKYGIDSAALPYVKRFEALYGDKVDPSISIWFGVIEYQEGLPDSGFFAGICLAGGDIVLDWDLFSRYDENKREALIFHELGHCEMDLEHDDRLGELGEYGDAPLSLMNSLGVERGIYEIHRKYYHEQMFNNVLPEEEYLEIP